MKRPTAILAALTAAALVAATGVAAASSPPRDQLTSFRCIRALDPANRAVSVDAVMRPVIHTDRLQLRFQLLRSAAGHGARRPSVARAGDLGAWISPTSPTLGRRPGDIWRIQKTVYDLDAPASFRFVVDFRWLGAHGRVLGTAVRRSGLCGQRELRPDLRVEGVTVSPVRGQPPRDRYAAVIANRGATGAGPFQILFTAGGTGSGAAQSRTDTAQSRTIQRLGAGDTALETFVGPACDASNPPTVVADSTSRVDDANRANNTLTVTCPATGSTGRRGSRAHVARTRI